jgi:hypothetical protein
MHFLESFTFGALLIGARLSAADSYANNQNPTVIDTPRVAANFPAIEGVELPSPAFINPGGVPGTFANGTSGPTPQYTLGRCVVPHSDNLLTDGREFCQEPLQSHRVDHIP